MAERFTLPPMITASSWGSVMDALWSKSSRGMTTDDEGTIAPKWTNREAVAVIAALRGLAAMAEGFPLWYQFAAIAYDWEPGRNRLDRSDEQADRFYDPGAAVMLNLEMQRLVGELDDLHRTSPRLDLDSHSWTDAALQGEIAKSLREDGAGVAFKIPLPACKDPVTGKPARPVKDPKTGKWTCPGGPLLIDDPITAIIKALAPIAVPLALILGAAWLAGNKRQRRQRR
jgi:hypothetical protein